MKKVVFAFLFLLAAVCPILSCASTKKIELYENSPAAVISITGTNLVSWKEKKRLNKRNDDENEDRLFNTALSKAIDRNNPEILTAKDRLDYADESFRRIVPDLTGLSVLDKELVTGSLAYKKTHGSFYNTLSDSIRASGYKDLGVLGAKKARSLMKGTGAGSLVSMEFDFKKILTSGTKSDGQAAALVSMRIKIRGSSGQIFINKEYSKQSSENFPVLDGDYDQNVLLSLIKQTTDEVIAEFAYEYSNKNVVLEKKSSDEKKSEPAEDSYSTKIAPTKLGKPKVSVQISEEDISDENNVDKKIEETAINLLKMGLAPEKIAEATGLSIEKVKMLENQIQSEKELPNSSEENR